VINTVRPGAVDWTGDNPFIYLKTDKAGDYSCLALYFRVAVSEHGPGQAMLVLESPYEAHHDRARRACLTNNLPMARYLIDGFVKRFALFRPCAALLDGMTITPGASFATEDPDPFTHIERAGDARGRSLCMRWEQLGEPFMADVPAAQTQTGAHEMFSVFQPAGSAQIEIDGQPVPGGTVERDFFGGRAQSAALAYSETWVHSIATVSDADALAHALVQSVRPQFAAVRRIGDVVSDAGKVVFHAGPGYGASSDIPVPVRNSMCMAAVFEGWAEDFDSAGRQLLRGEIRTASAQEHSLLVPLAGVLTASMSVLEINNADNPTQRVYVAINEGQVHATRFGRLDPQLPAHLRWLNDTVAPALKPLCAPPLALLPLMGEALQQGDDCHARTPAGSSLIAGTWRSRGAANAEVAAFLEASPAFALSFWMGAAALSVRAAIGVPGATLVTHAGGNGHEFGIQVAGRPGQWVRCTAPVPSGRVDAACAGALAVGALGDSAMLDFAGLGAQALRRAPALRETLGANLPKDALTRPGRILSGPQTAGAWRLRATLAQRCVEANLGPLVLLGMIDAAGKSGRIGGGVIDVPASLFAQASQLLERHPG
jgi:hypothetical protein